ncbi:hypothetical protein ACFVGN_00900 [Streptomyces sp. NPDC057757]|uniref:hypothetical protein n=1 Tax=Streptomyces sp. NPDC057757 TaxID=3346241 RepID=UPI0036B5B711
MTEQPLRLTQEPLNDLAVTYIQSAESLYLAIHDDIAARVRAAHPAAQHLEVSEDTDGDVELHGIWSAPVPGLGTGRLLRALDSTAVQDGPLDLGGLVEDLERVLVGPYLYRWGLAEPHPDHQHRDRRWITLPPADRPAHIAGIVRRYVPDAVSLICLFDASHGRIAVGFEEVIRADGERVTVPCPRCSPDTADSLWPHDVSHQLAAVLAQLSTLPHLRSCHLTPCVDIESEHAEQLWLLPFPHPEPAPSPLPTPVAP